MQRRKGVNMLASFYNSLRQTLNNNNWNIYITMQRSITIQRDKYLTNLMKLLSSRKSYQYWGIWESCRWMRLISFGNHRSNCQVWSPVTHLGHASGALPSSTFLDYWRQAVRARPYGTSSQKQTIKILFIYCYSSPLLFQRSFWKFH